MGTIKLTDDDHYSAIANAIRDKLGGTQKYTPAEMAPAINAMGGEGFVKPSGTKNITSNDTYDVKYYEYVNVAVPSTGITPTGTKTVTSNGTYDISSYASVKVQVSDYGIVPSGTRTITANGTYDITSYASVTVNVPMGTAPTATLTITTNGTHDVTEYGTVVVQVSGLNPTGTKSITANGTYDISSYASVNVNVPSSGITPSGTYNVTSNGTYNITNYATVNVQVASVGSGVFDIDDHYMVVIVNDPKMYATDSNYTTLSDLQTYLETTYVFSYNIDGVEHKPAYTFLMMNATNANVLARFKLLKSLGYGYCFGELLTSSQKSTLASNGFTDSIAVTLSEPVNANTYEVAVANHEQYINNGYSFVCTAWYSTSSYYGYFNTKYTSPLDIGTVTPYQGDNIFLIYNIDSESTGSIYSYTMQARQQTIYSHTFTVYFISIIGDYNPGTRTHDLYKLLYEFYYAKSSYVEVNYNSLELDNHIKTLNYICDTYTADPVHISGSGGTTTPTGTKNITSNGTYDVTNYASVYVDVQDSNVYDGVQPIFDIDDYYAVYVMNDSTLYSTSSNYTTSSDLQTYLNQNHILSYNGNTYKIPYTFVMRNVTDTNVLARFKLLKDLGYGYCFVDTIDSSKRTTLKNNGFNPAIAIVPFFDHVASTDGPNTQIVRSVSGATYYEEAFTPQLNYINNGFSFVGIDGIAKTYIIPEYHIDATERVLYNTKYTHPLDINIVEVSAYQEIDNAVKAHSGNYTKDVYCQADDASFIVYYISGYHDGGFSELSAENRLRQMIKMFPITDSAKTGNIEAAADIIPNIKTFNYICATYKIPS